MKKILLIISIIILGVGTYLTVNYYQNKIPVLSIEDQVISIDKLYTYGTHLNIEGTNLPEGTLDLVLYNGEFISIPLNITNTSFNLSNQVNNGYYLDELPIGKYYLFVRNTINDAENTNYYYYSLKNNTNYPETTYYTFSNHNKKIVITSEETYPTMIINVTKNTNKEVYDIVLDPGHGGMDGGASKHGYRETDFTMDIAYEIATILRNNGLKVKLTHEPNSLTKNNRLPEYGIHGRAVIPGEVHAKYLFSIHLNSSNYSAVKGLEIYTAADINYDLAKLLVNNITTTTGLSISNNKVNKMSDGVYTRKFTEADVTSSIKEATENDMLPYDYSTNSNYYYIIRETGGIVTGAYVDSRNPGFTGNPNYDTNTGTESYILELGYITNKSDLNNIINNQDKYIKAISDTILTLYKSETNE